MQLAVGFEPRALLANYLSDPSSGNYSVLLVLDAAKELPGASRQLARTFIGVRTEIPGPRARAVLGRRAAAAPDGLGRATDVVVERADGGLVFDADGNVFIDLAGGIGMLAVGHSPAPVVAAIQAQAAKYIHPCALVTSYEPYVRLAELLNEIAPGTFAKKTILANSGAEAVENAVKMSRKYTGGPRSSAAKAVITAGRS
jgi:4-aminobutyrate aminotransferase/(S)-3-amino-2-methylpropionate transaminase